MADEALYIALSNGAVRTLALEDDESAEELAHAIADRSIDYEWLATTDDTMVRVEAIDEFWIGQQQPGPPVAVVDSDQSET